MASAAATTSFPRGREHNLDDPNDVDPKDYPLFIQTVQGQTIRTLIEAIELILPEENFRFDSEGIKMLAIDVTQSLAIHLRLFAHRFEVYHCAKPVILGISILNLLKIMKTVGNLHTLTLYMEHGDDTHLYIRIENPDKKIRDLFRLNLVDLDRSRIDIPDETFPSIITMPSADFQKFVRDMSHIGDYVTITSVGDMFSMKVKGDFAEQEKIFGGSENCLSFLKSTSHEIIQGEFNLRCLVMFSRCTNLCNNIEMCFKNNYPLIIRYQVANLGDIKLAVVPRIREDE
jgi:proliferating cell nuclear antigen